MVCASIIFLIVCSWARNIVDVIEVTFCLSIFRPLDSFFLTIIGFDVFQKKVKSFPLFFIQLQTIDNFSAWFYTFKFLSTFLMNIIIDQRFLRLSILNTEYLTQFLYSISHPIRYFLSLYVFPLRSLVYNLVCFFQQSILVFVSFVLFEARLQTLKNRAALVVDLDYDRIVVFADCFEFRLDYGEANIILAWPERIDSALVGQISEYFGLENRGGAALQ